MSNALWVVAVCVAIASTGVCTAQPQPAEGDRPPLRKESELRKVVAEAIRTKAAKLRIPPGRYRIGIGPEGRAHLLFKNVHNMEIEARGVELVMTQPHKQVFVAFYDCSNITLRGLTVDCDPLQFTQGTIAAVGPNGEWYDLKIEPGYRTDVEAFGNPRPMTVFDPKTRRWKLGVPDLNPKRIERRSEDTWRVFVHGFRYGKWPVAVGDPAAIPYFGKTGFTCRRSVNITFEDCTIYQSGGMAFHEHAGGGNTVLRRCKVMRRPGTSRLFSTNADGFHCKNVARGPTVEDCLFEGMHDDAINIHCMFGMLLEDAKGADIVFAPFYYEWSKPGDKVELFSKDDARSLGIFTLKAVERSDDKQLVQRAWDLIKHKRGWGRATAGRGHVYRMTLDRPVAAKQHDGILPLNFTGNGFVLRNNIVRDIRYRGFYLKAANGIVEGNTLIGCPNDAITLTPEFFMEGAIPRNVIIRNNTIRHTGMLPFFTAAIRVDVANHRRHVTRPTAIVHSGVVIENNVIEDVAGTAIAIGHARDVVLRGNKISKVGHRSTGVPAKAAIHIRYSENVTLQKNTITDVAKGLKPVLVEKP